MVNLPRYYPEGEGDGVHVGDDMTVVDAALRGLKEKLDGVPSPETIRRIRLKLKLSQRDAAALFRVGENAFDRNERGIMAPSGPMIQLIALLDHHPELVAELVAASSSSDASKRAVRSPRADRAGR